MNWIFVMERTKNNSTGTKGLNMYVLSKTKRRISWCWEHGKSFQFGDRILNCARLGAEINLKADGCITAGDVDAMAPITVRFYIHKRTKG